MTTFSHQWLKLRDKKYREEFVATQSRRAIPFQIRALLKKKGVSQQQLAERAGLTQGVISRAANPSYGRMTLNTIIRVAAGFDVAFVGVFVPFSTLERFYETLSEEKLGDVATFEEEDIKRSNDDELTTACADEIVESSTSPGVELRMARVTPARLRKWEHDDAPSYVTSR